MKKINSVELKMYLKQQGIELQKCYQSEHSTVTSITLPFNVMNKMRRLSKKHKMRKNELIEFLLENIVED